MRKASDRVNEVANHKIETLRRQAKEMGDLLNLLGLECPEVEFKLHNSHAGTLTAFLCIGDCLIGRVSASDRLGRWWAGPDRYMTTAEVVRFVTDACQKARAK